MAALRMAVALTLGLAAASPCRAGTGTLRAQVYTDDLDNVLEPNESAWIRFWADMEPSVGEIDPDYGRRVERFHWAAFDILGTRNWDTGGSGFTLNYYLTAEYYRIRKDESTQNILDLSVAQFQEFGPWDFSDPIFLFDISWSPLGDYTPRRVEFLADVIPRFESWPDDAFQVWVAGARFYSMRGITVGFDVVPAPSSALVLGLGLAWGARRQR